MITELTELTDQQAVADELKRRVGADTDATGIERESARHALAAFERAEWQPTLLETVMQKIATYNTDARQKQTAAAFVRDLLLDYLYDVEPDGATGRVYGTADAGELLGLTTQGIKYHVYQTRLLRGTLIGKSLTFTGEQLSTFRRLKPAARGPKAN